MTRIIAFTNQKGGTGKTTSAVNVAAGLARGAGNGKRVLLIDADPQANATATLLGPMVAYADEREQPTLYEVLMEQMDATRAIRTVALAGRDPVPAAELDVLPSHIDLAAAEMQLVTTFEREQVLRRALAPIQSSYQYIIIDCPPSLGQLTINALMAAREVIVPVELGYYAFAGLKQLMNTISIVQRGNPALRIVGVLPTMETKTDLAQRVKGLLDQKFNSLLLPAIPRRTAIAEAVAAQKDIFAYKPASDPGVQAYGAVVKEVLSRG
jgi:chromosome partitioning protein